MPRSQHVTPIFTGVKEHAQKKPVQFHIPGHKQGSGMEPEFRQFIGENALSIDMINIAPLDDLHHPSGIIKEAQGLAAEAFGADYTFFSVQGTSGAIMTMIMSVCKPGEKLIVPRNVHKSIMSAIIFSGAMPIFIHPEIDATHGISHGVTVSSAEKALEAHPDAKGILVINPTYFGIAGDLEQIVQLAHSYSIPVLVDEAHGVHIHFHDELPLSAMQAGADMAATSVHKLGGSLTQSSILNIKEGLVSAKRVQAIISMLTTTSTSYLLLSSLDAARKQLAINGEALLTETIQLAEKARAQINKINGLVCLGDSLLSLQSAHSYDPTKLIISLKGLGISGHDAEVWLRENFTIEVELSDLYNILCIVSFGDTEEKMNILIHALETMSEQFNLTNQPTHSSFPILVPDVPTLALSPRDAFYSEVESVAFAESAGRIIAEFIMVYPPGIPILIPGEIITPENLDYVQKNLEAGLPVQGPEDETLQTLLVIKEQHAIR
ncbi:aminotransferase class I/II-fold pyridoxal phosphate-dependent enzyme [Alkalicoccobacillus plakortidis]|uniref:Aminotransferase class I/II-fold pyridoxal phosphate-dependent enzyme n=1 Tax=Alkalicoccobacillus plakortidis TaxID=444060 RepID=A0ABT0XGG5_9BACI|nr:aminotransferase class I/II-fold pyridoxal phosphate-dependent enzyme [Alkalicoccobacillus plakortidis]MCM2674865.1 aminotransferase class I/II-fold pyridoxal phosphate-dependent enzyme [Alkalicoccobacillus plakortidis]